MAVGLDQNRWKPEQPVFLDRVDAGERLGRQLVTQYGKDFLNHAVILGCPRGGAVVAQVVARVLTEAECSPSLDLVVCRKIPLLENPEYGIGAVTEAGTAFFVPDLVQRFQVDTTSTPMLELIEKVKAEVGRRIALYRGERGLMPLKDRVVIIIDDGIAGGVTSIAAIKSVRELAGGLMTRIIVAVPVAFSKAKTHVMEMGELNKEDFCIPVIAELPPGRYGDIEDYYHPGGFAEVSDAQVIEIMTRPSLTKE